jgi:hypothetical protein
LFASQRSRPAVWWAAIVPAGAVGLFLARDALGAPVADVLLASVLGGALVVLYGLRARARARLVRAAATEGERDGAVEHRTAATYPRLRNQLDADAASLTDALDRGTVAAVRRAYVDLDRSLGRTVAFAERRVPAAHRIRHPPPPLHPDRRREKLRFMALDDPRSRIPDTVRVATRAATGPAAPGLRVREHRTELPPGNGMGVDLTELVDRAHRAARDCRPPAIPPRQGRRRGDGRRPGRR